MMGSGGRGVSICPATCRAAWPAVPDSQRDRPAHSSPRERRWLRLRQAETGTPLVMQSLPARRSACPQRNSLPSAHMRCRITASLRATATRARATPRRLATFMPQARNVDHLVSKPLLEYLLDTGTGRNSPVASDGRMGPLLSGMLAVPNTWPSMMPAHFAGSCGARKSAATPSFDRQRSPRTIPKRSCFCDRVDGPTVRRRISWISCKRGGPRGCRRRTWTMGTRHRRARR
jgi:hypothetical protein